MDVISPPMETVGFPHFFCMFTPGSMYWVRCQAQNPKCRLMRWDWTEFMVVEKNFRHGLWFWDCNIIFKSPLCLLLNPRIFNINCWFNISPIQYIGDLTSMLNPILDWQKTSAPFWMAQLAEMAGAFLRVFCDTRCERCGRLGQNWVP